MAEQQLDLDARWRAFYREVYESEIRELARDYPTERSLYVDILDLHSYDPDLAASLLSHPERLLARAEKTLHDIHRDLDRANVRIIHHPGLVTLANLGSNHIHELVSIEGVVGDVSPVRSKLLEAVYECQECTSIRRQSPTGITECPPRRCDECGHRDTFELRQQTSTFVDTQRLTLLEPRDEREHANVPRSVDVHVDDDLVGTFTQDERVLVTGIVGVAETDESNRFDFFIKGITVEESSQIDRSKAESDGETGLDDVIESRWRDVVDS